MYLPSRKASAHFGVCASTLRKWADEGRIKYIRTPSNQRLYDCASVEEKGTERKNYCYCRVSSAKQRDDLERQAAFMRREYPDYTILTDVGSGLNFKRKQLLYLLEECLQGRVGRIVVAYRDRLCRFGIELLEWFFAKHNVELVVLKQSDVSPQRELVEDLLSIVTVFSCRVHGLRKYGDAMSSDKDLSDDKSESAS